MKPQLPEIENSYLLPVCLLFLSIALFIPAFLSASTQSPKGDAVVTAEHHDYLPVILKSGEAPISTPQMTPTLTPTTISANCGVTFEGYVVVNTDTISVTGNTGITVSLIDLSTNTTLDSKILVEQPGHACPGFAEFDSPDLPNQLVAGHILVSEGNDTTADTRIVLHHPPTPTPTQTHTAVPTNTPTNTATPIPTVTASDPYIVLNPNCSQGPTGNVTVLGYNWDTDEAITLSWNEVPFTIIPSGHSGIISVSKSFTEANGLHTIRAESNGVGELKDVDTAVFNIPCPGSETPTATPTPTRTPIGADLIIGKPQLISTPPIVAHAPLQFSVNITNNGELPVDQQFFVDLFLDPQTVYADHIPLRESDGYTAISSLGGGQSQQLTITAPLGFNSTPDPHSVYGMVDSVKQVNEESETNNISSSLIGLNVTPGATSAPTPTATATPNGSEPTPTLTPTATPTPDGTEQISGVVYKLHHGFLHPSRAVVTLIHPTLGNIATEEASIDGYYTFSNVPPLPGPDYYTITACIQFDTKSFFGMRTGVPVPYLHANIYMLEGPCP